MDRRTTPARPDLAAAHLEGQIEADRFIEPVDKQVGHANVGTGIKRQRVEMARIDPAPERIDPLRGGFRLDLGARGEMRADALILACPAHVSAPLLGALDPAATSRVLTVD